MVWILHISPKQDWLEFFADFIPCHSEIKKYLLKQRNPARAGTYLFYNQNPELGTLEWYISGLTLDPLFFLISRLINRSGLRISNSKVSSSGRLILISTIQEFQPQISEVLCSESQGSSIDLHSYSTSPDVYISCRDNLNRGIILKFRVHIGYQNQSFKAKDTLHKRSKVGWDYRVDIYGGSVSKPVFYIKMFIAHIFNNFIIKMFKYIYLDRCIYALGSV